MNTSTDKELVSRMVKIPTNAQVKNKEHTIIKETNFLNRAFTIKDGQWTN